MLSQEQLKELVYKKVSRRLLPIGGLTITKTQQGQLIRQLLTSLISDDRNSMSIQEIVVKALRSSGVTQSNIINNYKDYLRSASDIDDELIKVYVIGNKFCVVDCINKRQVIVND